MSLAVALTSVVVIGSNGCRVGYDVDELPANASGAAAAGGGSGGAGPGAGSDAGGSAGAVAAGGCTLASDPAISYRVGEAAPLAGYYVLRSISRDECVQTAGCGIAQESIYSAAPCSFEACQIFQAVDRGGGWHSLQNAFSGFCLDAGGYMATSAVFDISCAPPGHADEDRQSFQLVCAGDDTWRLVDRATQSYVAVAGADGASLEFQAALGGDQQRFRVEARPSVFDAVVPTSEADPGQLWRYLPRKPKTGWEQPAFDDSAWAEGPGGFGDGLAVSSPARTAWTKDDIWLRRSFTLDAVPDALDLRINHDFNAEIYINGIEAAVLPNWTSGYRQLPLNSAALASLVAGPNTIAVHCATDPFGEQFIDVGLGHFGW